MNKYARILVLAALAALAVTAIGASTASAKVCSKTVAGSGCGGSASHGELYSGALEATSTNAQLTSGFVNVSCTHSVLKGTVTGSTATGTITSMTFTGCTNNLGQNCTAATSAEKSNWPAKAVTETAPNGRMEVENITGEFTCGTTTCRYKTAKAGASKELVVTGGEPAKVTISSALPVSLEREEVSSGLCSSTAKWHGTYTVIAPKSLYLT
jgi:hypothetical protein